MGISLRIFLINDDDSIERLSLRRYERLTRNDPDERLPQYSGRRVRYAEIVVEFDQRKPVRILRIQYFIMSFDSEGRIDVAEQENESILAMDVLPSYNIDQQPSQVIDARHRFAKKRFDNKYRWRPTPAIEVSIVDAIFGK
jgi:hypothetical protein